MSPLERDRQAAVVVELMRDPPLTVRDLAQRFIVGLD
jgi:hypothetical protein